MTNEVAIKAMTKYMPKGNDSVSLVLREAMNMGIKALEQIPDLKDAYDKGYKDGQEALAFHLELCKEEEGATTPTVESLATTPTVESLVTTSSMESLVKPCKDCKKEQELKTYDNNVL